MANKEYGPEPIYFLLGIGTILLLILLLLSVFVYKKDIRVSESATKYQRSILDMAGMLLSPVFIAFILLQILLTIGLSAVTVIVIGAILVFTFTYSLFFIPYYISINDGDLLEIKTLFKKHLIHLKNVKKVETGRFYHTIRIKNYWFPFGVIMLKKGKYDLDLETNNFIETLKLFIPR